MHLHRTDLILSIAFATAIAQHPADAAAQPLTVIHRAPRKPEPGKKPPLLVLLHGHGANERDLLPMIPRLDPRLAVASPRAPFQIGSDNFSWTSGNSAADIDAARRTVLECIDQVVATTGADRGRVYLAGFSQGAMLTLAIALTEPEKIAGAAVLSGRLVAPVRDHHATADELRAFPILVVHGRDDHQIPIRAGHEVRDFLKPLAALEYHEFDYGHSVSDEAVFVFDQWLRKQLGKK
ncbi:MAG TPA: alpha/beta fold hydrolase [Vicinamibacterales bacterium]|nr:alpha/beta fold hydrolase [Vicinamibacterales bacterium]